MCLRGKHTIKRIAMHSRKPARSLRVENGDIQMIKLLASNTAHKICCNIHGAWQFPQPDLRAYFPRGRRTHNDCVPFVGNDSARCGRQATVAIEPP